MSNEETENKKNEIMDVNLESVRKISNKFNIEKMIHGHTHRPNVHKINNSKRIVLGDWNDYGWFLTVNDKDHELKKFSIS